MPSCPNCKSRVDSPEKVHTVIVEPGAEEHGITQREVGMYRCDRCETVFPHVISRRRYLFVPETEFTSMKKETACLRKEKDELEKTIEVMKKDQLQRERNLTKERERVEIEGLESQRRELERQVSYLRAQKEELQRETSH